MGYTVTAECPCGYKETSSIGEGRFGTDFSFPCYCKSCNSLQTIDVFSSKLTCPKCKSNEVTPYTHSNMFMAKLKCDLAQKYLYLGYLLVCFSNNNRKYVFLPALNDDDRMTLIYKGRKYRVLSAESGIASDQKLDIRNGFENDNRVKNKNFFRLDYCDYFCPKCKNYSMTFISTGLFD